MIYCKDCARCNKFSHCNNNNLICVERYRELEAKVPEYPYQCTLEAKAFDILKDVLFKLNVVSASGEYKRLLQGADKEFVINKVMEKVKEWN